MQAEVQVLYVTRYDIPNDNGRPNTKGTKIHYLGDPVSETDKKGRPVISVNGPYELFDRFIPEKLPCKHTLSLGQKMSGKKPVLTVTALVA